MYITIIIAYYIGKKPRVSKILNPCEAESIR